MFFTKDAFMNERRFQPRVCSRATQLGVPTGRMVAMLIAVLAIVSATGCGDGLKPVSGKLVVDGQPAAEGARVLFLPEGDTRQAEGVVTADGGFEMKTFQKKGVMPGNYKVTLLNSTKSIPMPDFSAIEPGARLAPPGFLEWEAKVKKLLESPPKEPGWIPRMYAEQSKTPLRWSVPKDGAKATFEVSHTDGDKAATGKK
jgi:hypothetical protein